MACSDNISEWINDVFEKTDNNNDIIKLKEIFKTFKDSEFYSNLSKSDKRKYNYKYFTEQMTTNLFLKKLVYQDSSKIYCLKNYKYFSIRIFNSFINTYKMNIVSVLCFSNSLE